MAGESVRETSELVTQIELVLGGDVTAALLPDILRGAYLYQIEVKTSDDDAVTFAINSEIGSTLYTTTTSAGTTGEVGQPTAYYWIHWNEAATYTLSSMSSGTAQVKITVVKK